MFLEDLDHWKIIDLKSDADVTSRYSFVKGWQTTIKSVMFLWDQVKDVDGFNFLNLGSLNQDPLENLFSSIRQHGAANTNPTCHQFTAALKTVVINKLVSPSKIPTNCELDTCTPLENLTSLMTYADDQNSKEVEGLFSQSDTLMEFNTTEFEDLSPEDTQGLAYVVGWVLKNINVPACDNCQAALSSSEVTNHHIFTSFKERDDVRRLTYAIDQLMSLVENIHDSLYAFLTQFCHQKNLEDDFKNTYKQSVHFLQSHFCSEHHSEDVILEKCVPFLIYKFYSDNKKRKTVSEGHQKKMKKFKKQ